MTKPVYLTSVALILLAGSVMAVALSWMPVAPIALGPLHVYRCQTAGGHATDTFHILTVTNYGAQALADRLCASPTLSRQFAAVEISWQPRGQLSGGDLVEDRFDLLWNRERVLKGLLSNYQDYYRQVQRTPRYSVYWLSNKDKPQLSADYFAGKRLGLLRDQASQSGFQSPLGQLHAAGIDAKALDIHYFIDRDSQYRAFLSGEVDLISGVPRAGDLTIPADHRLLITDQAPSGAWFLHRRHPRALRCDVLQALTVLQPLYQHINPHFKAPGASCEAS
ncbi:Putative membrane protein [Alloalcanivorax dieselolei B5]|uniref:Putative membrane protein n=1 Tax=Alcanivorax dieselolei (strain DSM 16502 / CGMCC 1.3690 / MCCC 1A00001 / B-5) TaxID=930169 RepID=K0CFU8_ALCDB|nr:hypothetical protein [Alloalcanivorax dieselolei]AFT71200.1 Putative membrane protein [Alloalcanivorax dieselolei B5]GGJ93888.1 hypothetical protein GCM10007426_23560 [Alloalcanivorax dieselolei]